MKGKVQTAMHKASSNLGPLFYTASTSDQTHVSAMNHILWAVHI